MTTTIIDARRQVAETMSQVTFSDMTVDELLSMQPILRHVVDRVNNAMSGPVAEPDLVRSHRRR